MRVQLAQQAKEILGKSDLVIITERVDDVALLIGQMVKMGLPEVLDRHIPRHWTQRGLSWGWTAVIWLAYIVTEGDHRKVSMETYLKGMRNRSRSQKMLARLAIYRVTSPHGYATSFAQFIAVCRRSRVVSMGTRRHR
jgi:hypothetical protein